MAERDRRDADDADDADGADEADEADDDNEDDDGDDDDDDSGDDADGADGAKHRWKPPRSKADGEGNSDADENVEGERSSDAGAPTPREQQPPPYERDTLAPIDRLAHELTDKRRTEPWDVQRTDAVLLPVLLRLVPVSQPAEMGALKAAVCATLGFRRTLNMPHLTAYLHHHRRTFHVDKVRNEQGEPRYFLWRRTTWQVYVRLASKASAAARATAVAASRSMGGSACACAPVGVPSCAAPDGVVAVVRPPPSAKFVARTAGARVVPGAHAAPAGGLFVGTRAELARALLVLLRAAGARGLTDAEIEHALPALDQNLAREAALVGGLYELCRAVGGLHVLELDGLGIGARRLALRGAGGVGGAASAPRLPERSVTVHSERELVQAVELATLNAPPPGLRLSQLWAHVPPVPPGARLAPHGTFCPPAPAPSARQPHHRRYALPAR